ncbi:MAG: mannosyltransferase [Bacteroidetes bacterium]|nr:mannosyltransferase [Bacteroidota bacterium]
MMTEQKNIVFKLGVISITTFLFYFLLSYYIKRNDTLVLLGIVGVLFTIYFYTLFQKDLIKSRLHFFIFIAFAYRLIFIFSTPNLSDDFYRFIWDGRLIKSGINPFSYLPDNVLQNQLLSGPTNVELFQKMNSPHYYSVYPPILQFIFYISVKFSFGNNFIAIIFLRLFILIAEIGTYIYIKKIITYLNLEREKILWYFLNPLVIIELSGNIHFEGVMLFFITASFYYLLISKLKFSSVLFALAVCTKLIPLIILPLIVKKIGLKKGIIYSLISLMVIVILFLPFIDKQLMLNIGNSIGLYFQKFEFNASFYYLLRGIGYHFIGYNAIGVIGKILPLLSFFFILLISLRLKNESGDYAFFAKALNILLIYYLFSLIVHPWYVTFLVLVSVFTNKKFALVWSALIFSTYITYNTIPYKENLWVVLLEYFVVLIAFIFEKRLKTINIFN